MKRILALGLDFVVASIVVVAGRRAFRQIGYEKRARSHASSSELRGMYALGDSLEFAAIADSASFLRFVGNGIKTNVMSIPATIQSNFLYSPGEISHMYKDSYGNPLSISIVRQASVNNGATSIFVKIWSFGPNGTDEFGAGDDRAIDKTIRFGSAD